MVFQQHKLSAYKSSLRNFICAVNEVGVIFVVREVLSPKAIPDLIFINNFIHWTHSHLIVLLPIFGFFFINSLIVSITPIILDGLVQEKLAVGGDHWVRIDRCPSWLYSQITTAISTDDHVDFVSGRTAHATLKNDDFAVDYLITYLRSFAAWCETIR